MKYQQVYPDDNYSDDQYNFNEEWPLESFSDKMEIKPMDKLDESEYPYFREA